MGPRLLWLVLALAPMLHAQLADQVRARLARLRETSGFPGISAGIVLKDGSLITAAAGLNPSDRMPVGSTGKTFIAAAILQSVEHGILDLDSKIERYLDEEPWFNRLPNARDLTLRLLLLHRSGIRDYVLEGDVTTSAQKNWTPVELISNLFDKPPLFPAGTNFTYADANYALAGVAFEMAVGNLFAEIERRFLKPFSLANTVTMKGGKPAVNLQAEYASGGIVSTAGDLARWAKLLWEGKVFSARLLDQMLDAKPTAIGRDGGREVRYGLAVQVQPSDFGIAYGHAGSFPGYQTEMVYFPEHKIAIAIQVNTDPIRGKPGPRACLEEIMKLVLSL